MRSAEDRQATGASPAEKAARSEWRDQDSNLGRRSHLIYSQTPLTARESRRGQASLAPGRRSTGCSAGSLGGVPQPLRLRQRLELLQRVGLDLADPLPGD